MTIEAAGKKRNVTTTAQTVAGALTAAKIKVDGNDKLSVEADGEAGRRHLRALHPGHRVER